MLWLALHFPQFGLEVAERRAGFTPCPHTPRVLIRDNRVLQTNRAAAHIGIRLGSTLATAHSVSAGPGEHPPLQHLYEDEDDEAERLAFVGSLLYRFSSEVSLDAPDAVVLEVGRSLRLFGSFEQLEAQAEALCARLQHMCCARTAKTPSAALALARAGASKLQAVPLSTLPIEAKHCERLANMGLTRLGQLMGLPRKELGQRFGKGLLNLLARMQGQAPDPREAIVPAARFRETLHLLEPLRSKDALNAPMQRLLDELAEWLTSNQLGAAALVWRFISHKDVSTVRLPVRLSRAQQNARAFFDISQLRLAHVELPEDVLGIGLDAHRLEPWSNQTLTLFKHGLNDNHAQAHASPAELAELLDQFSARLGSAACLHLVSIDQHAPEAAWQVRSTGSKTAPNPLIAPLRRPLWLFSTPQPVSPGALRLLEGPERIQTAWWADAVNRDYYVAEHDSGARCWAFQTPTGWYLHGYFA